MQLRKPPLVLSVNESVLYTFFTYYLHQYGGVFYYLSPSRCDIQVSVMFHVFSGSVHCIVEIYIVHALYYITDMEKLYNVT